MRVISERTTSYTVSLRLLGVGLALLLLGLLPLFAFAQAVDAEVDFYALPQEAEQPHTVGDRITLRLEVKHPADSQVILPQVEREWQSFEVVEQTPPQSVGNDDGTVTTGKDIVVSLFQPGRYQTPNLVVTHRPAEGAVEELAAPVVVVNITSVLTESTELRDLKPQAELPVPPLWPWVVGGLLATMLATGLLTGAGLWAYDRWFKNPVSPQIAMPIVDTRPPEVIAYAELDRIEALNLPAQNRIKDHYTLVSDCLRFYIEGRYRIPALEQTSQELRMAFRRITVPMRDVAGFMGILSESDLVKFARFNPAPEDVNSLVNRARAMVETTTPEPEPVKAVSSEMEVKS